MKVSPTTDGYVDICSYTPQYSDVKCTPIYTIIVVQIVDRFINRRPLGLGLIFVFDFRLSLDPVFRGFSNLFML